MEGGGGEEGWNSKMKKLNPGSKTRAKSQSRGTSQSRDVRWTKTCPLSPTEGAPWVSVDEKIYQWDLAEAVDNGDSHKQMLVIDNYSLR